MPSLPLRLTAAAGLALASAAAASPPALLSVQGRLATTGGQPLTGPVTLTSRLYDDASAGTLLHDETELVTLDADGTFVTALGDDEPLDLPDFAAPLWASFQVGAEAETSPRLRLVPAPYALRALVAEDLAPQGPLSMASERLTDLATPTQDQDAATKAYVDEASSAVSQTREDFLLMTDSSYHDLFTARVAPIPGTYLVLVDVSVDLGTTSDNLTLRVTQDGGVVSGTTRTLDVFSYSIEPHFSLHVLVPALEAGEAINVEASSNGTSVRVDNRSLTILRVGP